LIVAVVGAADAATLPLPPEIEKQFPTGYKLMTFDTTDLDGDKRLDCMVVAQSVNETANQSKTENSEARPLLIFLQRPENHFTLMARNDAVVLRKNDGGQCDPFMDGEEGIAAKGAYFTVQNAVACGEHWTDYTTFMYSQKQKGVIFYKRIFESLVSNPDTSPNAEPLITGTRKVVEADPAKPIFIQNYKPKF
jgi:hypothetical protein